MRILALILITCAIFSTVLGIVFLVGPIVLSFLPWKFSFLFPEAPWWGASLFLLAIGMPLISFSLIWIVISLTLLIASNGLLRMKKWGVILYSSVLGTLLFMGIMISSSLLVKLFALFLLFSIPWWLQWKKLA